MRQLCGNFVISVRRQSDKALTGIPRKAFTLAAWRSLLAGIRRRAEERLCRPAWK